MIKKEEEKKEAPEADAKKNASDIAEKKDTAIVDTEVKEKESYKPIFKIDLKPKVPELPDYKTKSDIDVRYPLMEPFVYAHIYWDEKQQDLVYELQEPVLDKNELKILKVLEKGIEELINISFIGIKSPEAVIEFLEKNVKVLLNELGISINKETFLKIMYYIFRDFVGLNRIEPMMRDYFIEDIECNGIKSNVYIVHRKYRNIRTNLVYPEIPELTSFVEKLAQKCGKYISYASPLLDGSLPDGSVEYNEPLIYRKNGMIKVNKIGSVVDKYYKNEFNKPVAVSGIEIPAFDPNDLKIKWKKTDYVYRHKLKDNLLKLNLETGRHVSLTPAHSIFILRKDGIKIEKTENIKKGDYVVVPLKIPENDNFIKQINLAEKLSKHKKIWITNVPENVFLKKKKEIRDYLNKNYKRLHQSYYDLKKKKILPICLYKLVDNLKECYLKTTSNRKIPIFLNVDKYLMRLLGYYVSEGWLFNYGNHYGVQFCLHKDEKRYINEIEEAFERNFNQKVYVEKPEKNAVKIKMHSYIIWNIFKDILEVKKYALKKEIPPIVYNVPVELQKEFARCWKNGDYGSSASEKLMSDLSYLSLFNREIMSYSNRTRTALIENREVKSTEFYTNCFVRKFIDAPTMIPMELFNPLNKTHLRLKNKRIRKERLLKILNELRYKRFEKLSDLKKVDSNKFMKEWAKRGFINNDMLTKKGQELIYELNLIKGLINGDLGFVKIKSIEKVNSNSDYVYDLSVKGFENFISGFGGVCCHNSRVNSTYTQDISSKGPAFTIRKFTKTPWSPIQLMQLGTISPEILAYLWLLIEYESNLMVIGGTASGKTTLLNCIAFFVPPAQRIVSIEDTHELSLTHENWLPSVARSGFGAKTREGAMHGEVSLFDLLKESFRQRPDYVIVGEIRGKEAYVLFQGAASGHSCLSTMHAEDVQTMIRRLETEPINLSPALVKVLNAVCVMTQVKIKGKPARRVREITEIVDVDQKTGEATTNAPFVWDPRTDRFFFKSQSILLDKIAVQYGLRKENLYGEFQLRAKLLMELYRRKIIGFEEVGDIIRRYYKNKTEILKKYGVIS